MALFRTPLCIFITNSQPSAYLHFAAAPLLLHHSVLSHLYSISSLPLVILHASISLTFPLFVPPLAPLPTPLVPLSWDLFFLFSIPAEESWHWARGQRDGQSCSFCQRAQMGLDTVNVEAPLGLPRPLWALFTNANALHIQSCTSAVTGSSFKSGIFTLML